MLFLANEGQKTRLQKMQNKVMRLIFKCGRRTKIEWMLDALQWLSVRQRLDLNTMVFVYKIVHKHMPQYLTEKIIHVRDTHEYNTRVAVAGNFELPKMTMAVSQNCLFYKGVRMFNNLDQEIKNARTISEFKKLTGNSVYHGSKEHNFWMYGLKFKILEFFHHQHEISDR
jgi:hypothetical protein